MKTTNIRRIFNVEVKHEDNGAFALEITHAVGETSRRLVRLHFDSFWWVGCIAAELWKVVKRRREMLTGEIEHAEGSLRGTR